MTDMQEYPMFTIHREDETKPDRVALVLLPGERNVQTIRAPDPDRPWVADTHVCAGYY